MTCCGHSSCNQSTGGFCQAACSMKADFCPDSPTPGPHALATHSGPLSLLTRAGGPRRMSRSVTASITSVELSFRFTWIGGHPRLNSSKTFSARNAFPSPVRQCTKIRPNMVTISGCNRMHVPSLSQSLPDFGCFGGTFSRSRRHSRSIQLKLTCQTGSRSCTAPPDSGSCHIAGPARSFRQPAGPGLPGPLDDAAASPAGTC